MDNNISLKENLIKRTKNYKFHKVFHLDLDVFIFELLLLLCCALAPGAGMFLYIFGFIFFISEVVVALNVK